MLSLSVVAINHICNIATYRGVFAVSDLAVAAQQDQTPWQASGKCQRVRRCLTKRNQRRPTSKPQQMQRLVVHLDDTSISTFCSAIAENRPRTRLRCCAGGLTRKGIGESKEVIKRTARPEDCCKMLHDGPSLACQTGGCCSQAHQQLVLHFIKSIYQLEFDLRNLVLVTCSVTTHFADEPIR